MSRATTLHGTFVTCGKNSNLKIYKNYVLHVDDNGFISVFAPQSSEDGIRTLKNTPSGSIRVLSNYSFLLPVFYDLHLHAPQMLYQGTGLDLPLMQWLDKYAYKSEMRIDQDPKLASEVYGRLARKLIEHGTGVALLFGTIKTTSNLILAKACQESGLRAFVGKLSMDISTHPSYVESSVPEAITAAREFIEGCRTLVSHLPVHERLVQPVITPRFVPTCTIELLSHLGDLASEHKLMIQSHLAESKDQVALVRETHLTEDLDIFQKSGLLTPRTIQAHCTFLCKDSLNRLKLSDTSIAHCPLSNTYFSSQPFALREAIDLDVKVGLGTDIAGGYNIDIMSAMRMAVIVSRMRDNDRIESGIAEKSLAITWKEALYLATEGGRNAVGLPVSTHPFEIGLPFDAQLIELYDETERKGIGNIDLFDDSEQGITEELLEKWWCLGDTRNRSAMFIQGSCAPA